MLALHAVWSSAFGAVRLWAEDASLVGVPASPAGGPPAGRWPSHPFAATGERLIAGVEAFGIKAAGNGEMTLLLPGSRSRPRPSPTVVRLAPPRYPRGRPTLGPWTVPAVTIDPAVVLDLAGRLGGLGAEAGTGVVAGPSLAWWAPLAGLALDLVARGRVLPAVAAGQHAKLEARWLPFPTPDDVASLRRLAEAVPPAIRAEVPPDGQDRAADAAAVVDAALAWLVDGAARSALAGTALLPRRRGRTPATLPAGEAFVAALTAADATLTAEAEECEKLQGTLADWLRSGQPPAGPLRTCFRLAPPGRRRRGRRAGTHARRGALAGGVPPAIDGGPEPPGPGGRGVAVRAGPAGATP